MSKTTLRFTLITCVICSLASACFINARHKAKRAQVQTAELNRITSENLISLKNYIQNGAGGVMPEFKLSGNADLDNLFSATRDFYSTYLRNYSTENSNFMALHEVPTFSSMLLTNEGQLEAEIQKRTAAEELIEQFATNSLLLMVHFRKTISGLRVSDENKYYFLTQLFGAAPKYKKMFDSWAAIQTNEKTYLQFIQTNFDRYAIENNEIIFNDSENMQRYADLVEKVKTAKETARQFQTQATIIYDATVKKMQ